MIAVEVIKAEGARVTGPCKLRLSAEQWSRRTSVLGPAPKRAKIAALDGGQALQFKQGEIFEIEAPERLNRELFRWDEPEEVADGAGGGTDEDVPDLISPAGDDD